MTTRSRAAGPVALALSCLLTLAGCASATRGLAGPPNTADRAVIAEYVQKLPVGTTVRVERVSGRGLRGTLMKITSDTLVLQLRTRLPEPPVEVPFSEVLRVTPESGNGHSLAKAIGIGAAAGAGAALGVFLIIIAAFSD